MYTLPVKPRHNTLGSWRFLRWLFLLAGLTAVSARAAGVVGVCDSDHLFAALDGGGAVTFACSGTITLANTITFTSNTTIDGSGQNVALDGNTYQVQLLSVNSGVSVGLNHLTLQKSNLAIHNAGNLVMTNSTIADNAANGSQIVNLGVLTIANSTINTNDSVPYATILNQGGTLTISGSTIAGNFGSAAGTISGGATISNSILVANKSALAPNGVNCAGGGIVDGGYNLDDDGSCGFTATGSKSGDTTVSLGSLANNGGWTQTLALLAGDAVGAIPAGANGCGTAADQRGMARPGSVGAACSMGAYEFVAAPTTVVTDCTDDTGLRTAVAAGGRITFSCGAGPVTITVNSGNGPLTVSANTTIDGVGNQITLSGGSAVRIFSAVATLVLNDLTVANGKAENGGGAYQETGSLVVTNCTFSSNTAIEYGGGVYFSSSATLIVTNSTFVDNASAYGGGITSEANGTIVTGSTFLGNNTQEYGGGIWANGLTLRNSTFSSNSAGFGGAIFVPVNNGTYSVLVQNSTISGANILGAGNIYASFISGLSTVTVTLQNTLVTGALGAGGNCVGSTFVDGGYNLDDDGTCGFSAANHSLSDNKNANLGALSANGGPTQTIPLLAGSAAIDAIPPGSSGCGTTIFMDQRGVLRPQGAGCDMGAFEFEEATQNVSLPPIATQTVGAQVALPGTDSMGLPVTYSSATPVVCSVSGTMVTVLATGTCTLTAAQPGYATDAPAAVIESFFVFGLGTASELFGPAAGSGSDIVNVAAGASWSATTTTSWIHLLNGSGTGAGLATFNYDANAGATRTGSVAFSSGSLQLTLNVTQAGAGYAPATQVNTLISSGLLFPRSIAVDSNGNLYIADGNNNAVMEWTASNGQVTTLFSESLPYGVTVDGLGDVYSTSEIGPTYEWSAATGTRTLPIQADGPVAAAVDSAGDVYVADANGSRLLEWSPLTGLETTVDSSALEEPWGVAVDVAGNVYESTLNPDVKEWNPSTQQFTAINLGTLAYGLAVDGAGNLYAAAPGASTVVEWNPVTQQTATLVSSGLNRPWGIAVDRAGNVYISDTSNSAIKELPYALVPTASFTEPASAGDDQMLPVLPATVAFTATSDQSWLSITGQTAGVVSFSFSANASAAVRTAHISVLGQTITVNQAAQTAPQSITFNPIPTQVVGSPLTLTATASSTLPVSYSSSTQTVCTVSGSAVTLLSPGTCTITASQLGNASYAPATSVLQSFSVVPSTDPVVGPPAITSSAGTIMLTYTATTGGAVSPTAPVTVFTEGVPNLAHGDFSLATNTCVTGIAASATCSVTIDFNPLYAGLRTGAVVIAGDDGKPVSTAYISGIGTGSQLTFAGANSKTLLAGGSPSGVAVDGAGDVFSIDSLTGALKEVPPNGPSKTISFTIGTGPSRLTLPLGLALDAAGNLYIADTGNMRVVKLAYGASTASVLPITGISFPMGLAFDAAGNLYIANSFSANPLSGTGSIVKVAAGTGAQSTVNTAGSGLRNPTGIAVDAGGDLFVTDYPGNRVVELPATGSPRSIGTGLQNPAGVAVDAAGDVFISDELNNRIVEVPGTGSGPGTGTQIQILPGLGLTWGLALDGPGNLYLTSLTGNVTQIPRSRAPALPPFPPTATGGSSAAQTVQVFNIGNQALNAAGFSASTNFGTNACGGLAPGSGCTLDIVFAPVAPTLGPVTGGTVTAAPAFDGPAAITGLSGTAARSQTIQFAALPARTLGTAPVIVSAAASSALPVAFSSQTAAICTVAGSTVTLNAVGKCTIQATQAGNASYAAAPAVEQSFQVTPRTAFTLAAKSSGVLVTPSTPAADSITVDPDAGFSGVITFSVTGLPSGVTGKFTPLSVDSTGSTSLALSAAPGTPTGRSAKITVTGTAGSIAASTSVTLSY
ncbi:MAG: choice-of-anchor Q domain-containing protein [Bryobacteraceae bacterium]|jgi:sugar lactone lactonase YvrE